METINPTRMNLLLKREELKDASTGADLLRNKRDVLLAEFFSTLKPLMALSEALDNQASQACQSLAFSWGIEGREKLLSYSFIKSKAPTFEIKYKNLLGLKVPSIVVEPKGSQKGFARIDTSLVIEETEDNFQDFLNLALKILPEELKLKRLGTEIKSTTRKVNSLEKFAVPQLYAQIKFIQEALEEREREDIFRLKIFSKRAVTSSSDIFIAYRKNAAKDLALGPMRLPGISPSPLGVSTLLQFLQ